MSEFLNFCTKLNRNDKLFGSNFTDSLVIGVYPKEVKNNLFD